MIPRTLLRFDTTLYLRVHVRAKRTKKDGIEIVSVRPDCGGLNAETDILQALNPIDEHTLLDEAAKLFEREDAILTPPAKGTPR